ncbi:hypothetical protein LCGC14_0172140 [marine sediment metagenome]|uniref:Lipoprotein n=2 Tax=root TaxID=1 RepID=A0A7V1FSP6_9GAMM|nr:hypothetical protein [Halopseudomonas xinjiangensis]
MGPPSVVRIYALVLAILLTSGCSITRLGYENLDWIVGWKVRDYVALNREQKRWLKQSVNRHVIWHCNSELPRYVDLLESFRLAILSESPAGAQLYAQTPAWQTEITQLLDELAPTVAGLLVQLDEDQIQTLLTRLDEEHQALYEDYVKTDVASQNRDRSERMQKRLKHWFGRMTPEQRERVDQWAVQLEGQNELWLENRKRWQTLFKEALADRDHASFQSKISALVSKPQQFWTAVYQEQRTRSLELATDLISDLMASATDRQKHRFTSRANDLIQDLKGINCPLPPA